MSYGMTLEQVSRINRPVPTLTSWGSLVCCGEGPRYALFRCELSAGGIQPLHFHPVEAMHVFVESGDAVLRTLNDEGQESCGLVRRGGVVELESFRVHGFASVERAVLYMFARGSGGNLRFIQVESRGTCGPVMAELDPSSLEEIGCQTSDVREKYWGRIETILSGEIAGKRIFVRKDAQSSLEFHVEKHETYYVDSGRLRIGLRVGRAENHSIVLGPGESYDVRPGVMHMRMGIDDTVIIEASTRDCDTDSFLVEDGQRYRHVDTAFGQCGN